MMNAIIENRFIGEIVQNFSRSPRQANTLHETDAEIIRLSPDPASWLAITTDSIAEEISTGLYDDPYLAGWMSVMANMSDLAAVGSRPLGILISLILPHSYASEQLAGLRAGIQDACSACGTYVLGGDTNTGDRMVITGSAVGTVDSKNYLTRVGCHEGDLLYATRLLGSGNAFALSQFGDSRNIKYEYKPVARLREGQLICGLADACMDTSDGVISTLDQLMRLNRVGFELDEGWADCIEPYGKRIAEVGGIPSWLLLAGQHGEFELLFTVPTCHEDRLLETSGKNGWKPVRLGRVINEPVVRIDLYGRRVTLDTELIRNLPARTDGDTGSYIRALLTYDSEIKKGDV